MPEKVYKLRGVTESELLPELVMAYITEPELVKKWDPLLQSTTILQLDTMQWPVLKAGYQINRYGVPGFSYLCHDREFLMRVLGLQLPDGSTLVVAYSAPPDLSLPGDTGPGPRTVRAHMAVSGLLSVPLEPERAPAPASADVGRGATSGVPGLARRSEVTMVVQVDPMGTVPLIVFNTCYMILPMNLQRLKGVVSKASAKHSASMVELIQGQVTDAQQLLDKACTAAVTV